MSFDGFSACTLDELKARADAQMAEWLKTRKAGIAEHDSETNQIKIEFSKDCAPYPVDLDYLKTGDQLLNMIFHISGKSWCKGSVLTDFIQCLTWVIRERHDQTLWEFFLYN